MALYEVTNIDLLQRCAKCEQERRIDLAELEVGLAHDGVSEDRILMLPLCPTCKSSEFLIRSAEDELEHPAPGTFGHLHRLLVDHLHAELVKRGQVIDVLRASAVARPVSAELLATWFPHGLKIGVAPVERPRAKGGEPWRTS